MIDNSISELKKAIGLDPYDSLYHSALGDAYLKKEMLDEALSEYKKAIGIDHKHASSYYNIGCIYEKKGVQSKADDFYYKAGLLYLKEGDRDKAIKANESMNDVTSKELKKSLFDKIYPGKKGMKMSQ